VLAAFETKLPLLLVSALLVCCNQVYAAIREELAPGGCVYIVCPLVSESSSDALTGVCCRLRRKSPNCCMSPLILSAATPQLYAAASDKKS
jgi:hypothetical protein